jgi:hypothetical protein
MWAIAIASVCFVAFPLRLMYPHPNVSGVLGFLFDSLGNFYNYYNLAPSLHIALRSILWPLYIPLVCGLFRNMLQLWFFFIGLSTLFVWQHHLADVFTGQLLGLAMIYAIDSRRPAEAEVLPRELRNLTLAIRYLSCGALFLGLSALASPATLVFLWPMVCFGAIGVQYARGDTWLFRKLEGEIRPGTRLLFLPYFAALRIMQRHHRRGLPECTEVAPGLYIGSHPSGWELTQMKQLKLRGALDCAPEWPRPEAFEYLPTQHVPIMDFAGASPSQLRAACEFIDRKLEEGPVLVFCSLGLSRSVLIAASYLMFRDRDLSPERAIEKVRSKQPRAVLTRQGRDSLRMFDARM